MADQQAPVEQTDATQQTDTEQAPETTMAQLEARVNELPSQIVEQLAAQFQPAGDPWAEQFGPLPGEEPQQQQYDPYQQQQNVGQEQVQQAQQEMAQQGHDWTNPQAVAQYIQEQVTNAVQAATYPDQIGKVLDKYPELRTDQATADAVVRRIAQAGFDPRQNIPPAVLEMAYKAHKADVIAGQQDQAQGPGPQASIEAGGASQEADQPDIGDQLFGPRPQAAKSAFGWAQR